MTPKRVRELLAMYENGWKVNELAVHFGVSPSTVSRVITGKTWVTVTGGRNRSRAGQTTEYRCAYITARLEQGCGSHMTIARELGISRQAVAKLISTKNLGGQKCSAL